MALPAGMKLQLGIGTAGALVDVSADVDGLSGLPTQYGRSSEQSQPVSATFSVTLDNSVTCSTGQGSYTPGRQVLYDGTTVHPYYPQIVPRVAVVLSYTISASTYYLFTGEVKSWSPTLVNEGMVPRVVVQASDILDRLSRTVLSDAILQEALQDSPRYVWPLTDPVGSASAAELLGGTALFGGATFGQPGPGAGTGVQFTAGQHIRATGGSFFLNPLAGTYEVWVKFATYPTAGNNCTLFEFGNGNGAFIDSTGALAIFGGGGPTSAFVTLNTWHLVTITHTTSTSGNLYLDGVLIQSSTISPLVANFGFYLLGDTLDVSGGASNFTAGYASYTPAALSGTRLAAHYAAGVGYPGDTTGARIARYLTFAGLTTSDWTLDTGSAVVGAYPLAGASVLQACQDMATTEGGGAAFYVLPNGKVRFADRTYRGTQTSPVLTVDAGADLDGQTFAPALDSLNLINQATVTRANGDASTSTQTFSDADSISQYGLFASSLTSYAVDDIGALTLAQYQVAANRTPGYRLAQVSVDFMTATTAGLYAANGGVQIGSRLRVANLDAAASPLPILDFYIEGWALDLATDKFMVTFDTTAADNPVRGKWDTMKWKPVKGDSTLNATITATATSLAIAWVLGPQWTVTVGQYPIVIKIEEEQIQLNGVPGGSTSPQAWTGCTRGVNGTIKAAHAAGAVISIPNGTWQL